MTMKQYAHPLAQPRDTTSSSAATFSRFAAGAVLSVLSAGLAALATPPFPVWPLILLAFVPMIVAQHRVLPPRWSALAPGITLGFWFASQLLEGLVEAGVPLVFQLLPFYAGVIAAALSWRTCQFHNETKYRWFFLATPVGWVAIDFVRGHQAAMLAGTWGKPGLCTLGSTLALAAGQHCRKLWSGTPPACRKLGHCRPGDLRTRQAVVTSCSSRSGPAGALGRRCGGGPGGSMGHRLLPHDRQSPCDASGSCHPARSG